MVPGGYHPRVSSFPRTETKGRPRCPGRPVDDSSVGVQVCTCVSHPRRVEEVVVRDLEGDRQDVRDRQTRQVMGLLR